MCQCHKHDSVVTTNIAQKNWSFPGMCINALLVFTALLEVHSVIAYRLYDTILIETVYLITQSISKNKKVL